MSYTFGSGVTDVIACGTPDRANTFTVAARFSLAAADTDFKTLAAFRESGSETIQFQLLFGGALQNVADATISVGGTPQTIPWQTGFLANDIHTLVVTYDGHFLRIYADADSTAKATSSDLNANPDQSGSQAFDIGNVNAAPTLSLNGTIYEVGWWPGTVLTGSQAALLGTGGQMPNGFPAPSNYWPLTSDATDLIGSADGTVTGATLTGNSGTSWFPAAAPPAAPPTLFIGPNQAPADMTGLATSPAQWAGVRAKTSGIWLSPWHFWTNQTSDPPWWIDGNILSRMRSTDFLRRIRGMGLKIAVGLIGITHPNWPPQGLTATSIALDELANIHALGGTVDYIDLDTSIGRGVDKGLSQGDNVAELKDFYDAINAVYPGMSWGDADCITSYNAATILSYMDAYIAGGVPLEFFNLDPVYVGDPTTFWTQAGLLAAGLDTRGILFSTILDPGIPSAYVATDAAFCGPSYTFAQDVQTNLPGIQRIVVNSFYSRTGTDYRDVPITLPESTANTLTKLASDVATLFSVADVPVEPAPLLTVLRQLQDARA